MDVRPGEVLSHFRLLEVVGEGGMGVVFRARDLHLERDVALKVLSRRRPVTESALHRFRREALALSRLNHPNIAAVFDFDAQDDIPFLVMEWISGVSLDVTVHEKLLSQSEVVEYGQQIAAGLDYAHREGVIHRDLKPGNLLLNREGRIKIVDFGLASLKRISESDVTETLPGPHSVGGTLPYVAPELLGGHPASVTSDVYALGAVLYEMATGRRAFPQTDTESLSAAILHEQPALPRTLNPRLSPELEHLIMKALEKQPHQRYPSVADLAGDLRRIREGLPLLKSRRFHLSRPVIGLTATLVTVIAIAMVGFVVSHAPRVAPVMQAIATTPADEWLAQISPDKEWICFLAGDGEKQTVWLQRLKGGAPIPLATEVGIDSPIWSPDGERIAFLVIHGEDVAIRTMRAFGGEAPTDRKLAQTIRSPQLVRWIGSHIYLDDRRSALYRLHAGTGELTRVVEDKGAEGFRDWIVEYVRDVSSDLSLVTFDESREGCHLWQFEARKGEHRQLTADTLRDRWPTYSRVRNLLVVQRQKPAIEWRKGLYHAEILMTSFDSARMPAQ